MRYTISIQPAARKYTRNKNMFFYSLIFITPIITLLMSCSQTYKIKERDLGFNPYKKGDSLIFKSNRGEMDTLIVEDIYKSKNPDDNLAAFPNQREHLKVVMKHSSPDEVQTNNPLHSVLLEIIALDNTDTIINFQFSAKGAKFYREHYNKKTIDTMSSQKLAHDNIIYDDVLRLTPNSNEYYERPNFITALFWSRRKGYIRYELKNGVYWNLQ